MLQEQEEYYGEYAPLIEKTMEDVQSAKDKLTLRGFEEDARSALIMEELKRCADEMASTDLTMQTIRDVLRNE